VKRTLEVHELKADERYYLAVFLVGAYQETLGDCTISLATPTWCTCACTTKRMVDRRDRQGRHGQQGARIHGSTNVAELYPALARECERAIRDGRMTLAQSQALKRFTKPRSSTATRTSSRRA